jgi:hypothetical protein
MGRFASTIEIAGVSFTGCRGFILDGEQFATSVRGSADWAADGTPHVQMVAVGAKGLQFGVQLVQSQNAKLAEMLEAIEDAQAQGQTFEVRLADGLFDIHVHAYVDFTQGWFQRGQESEGWTANTTVRFISMGQVIEE